MSEFANFIFISILFILFAILTILRDLTHNKRIIIGLCFGLLLGFGVRFFSGFASGNVSEFTGNLLWVQKTYNSFAFITNIFVNYLQFLALVLVFLGICSMLIKAQKNPSKNMFLAIFWLIFFTIISCVVGILIAYFLFYSNLILPHHKTIEISLFSSIFNVDFKNPIAICIFAFILIFGAKKVDDEPGYEKFSKMIIFCHKISIEILKSVIFILPCIIVCIVSTLIISGKNLNDIFYFIFGFYLASFFAFLIHMIFLRLFGFKILFLFKKMLNVLLLAFFTNSSVGVLQKSTQMLQNFGVKNNDILNLGASVGMNGHYAGFLGVFLAFSVGWDLSFWQIIIIVIISVIASFSVNGVPGVGIVAAFIVCVGMNAPLDNLILIIAIDPLISGIRSSVNASSSIVCSLCAYKFHKKSND